VCEFLTEESKNLTTVETRTERVAGATITDADIKGMLVGYEAKMILRGLNPKTVQRRINLLQLLRKRGADLLNPESVFRVIDQARKWGYKNRQLTDEPWSEGSKNNAARSYVSFCRLLKILIPEEMNFSKWGHQPQKIHGFL